MRITLKKCLTICTLVLLNLSFVPASLATDWGVLTITDSPSSTVISEMANHDITFTTISAVPMGGQISVSLHSVFTAPEGQTPPLSAMDYTNVDLIVNGSQRSLGAAASPYYDGVSVSGNGFYFTIGGEGLPSPMGGEIPAGATVRVLIGTNVTWPTQGQSTKQFQNPSFTYNAIGSVTTTNAALETIDGGSFTVNIVSGSTVQFGEQYSTPSSSGSESVTSVSLAVKLNAASASTVTVHYAATGGTASSGTDFTLEPGTLSFSPGTVTANIPLTIINDTTGESNETVVVVLSSPTNATIGENVSYTYTIVDNDTPGTLVGISESNHSTDVTEGGATDTYTIWLDHMPTSDVTVTITPSSQVKVSSPSVDFSMGTWMAEQTITVSANNDTDIEGTHTGTITHTVTSTDSIYNGAAVSSVTVHITDNDTAPTQAATSTPPVVTATSTPPVDTSSLDTGTSTLKMGTTTPPVEIKFSDVDNNDKLTVANKKAIYEIVNLMVLKKTYKAQAKFGPNAMVKPDFAIRIALAIAGKSCGTTINVANCKATAVKAKLVKTGELITKNVTRAEFYRIILRASKLGFIDIKTITPAVLKKDLPKDAEFTSTKPEDVKFKRLFAQTILTAKEYKIIAWFKGTKSQAAKNFNRAAAVSIVSKLLAAMASAKAK